MVKIESMENAKLSIHVCMPKIGSNFINHLLYHFLLCQIHVIILSIEEVSCIRSVVSASV